MQGPLGKPQLPRCRRCGAGSPRVVSRAIGNGDYAHEWLCAACEYAQAHPEAPRVPLLPRERRAAPLQRETLF